MSTNADLQAEIDLLRSQVEEFRQRELEDLRTRLMEAEHAVRHFRSEADRNASAAKELVSMYEKKLSEMQTKLTAYETWTTRANRVQSTN